MKKTFIIIAVATFAFVACNKDNTVIDNGPIDTSKVVFSINVNNADADTKGVKTAWENGDDVYVFFQDNTTQYVKMTFNGTSWAYTDKDGGTTFTGLTLTASGKKLSAVYMPDFVCSSAPSYSASKWTFGSVTGYYQTAVEVDYTVTTVDNVNTLNASIDLYAPANMVQVYINESAPASGNEYVLNMTNVKPFTFDGIAPGGAATITAGTDNFPLPAYNGTFGEDAGYYFWGILDYASAGAIDYNFQLVEQDADKKYAISSKSKTVNANITGPKAIKLTSLTSNGKFVSLGYSGGGPLWATGNLNDDGSIAGPLEAGDYYKWCYTTPYDVTGDTDPYANYYHGDYTESRDPARVKTGGFLCTPTADQFENLCLDSTINPIKWNDGVWKYAYLVTSDFNGITLCFPAVGFMDSGVHKVDSQAYVWTSSPVPGEPSLANYLFFQSGTQKYCYEPWDRFLGFPIRPIQL